MNGLDRQAALKAGLSEHYMAGCLNKRAAKAIGLPTRTGPDQDGRFYVRPVPDFKTDMNAAMELDGRAFEAGWELRVERKGKYWLVSYYSSVAMEHTDRCSSEVLATAITLAFLELKLGEKI